MKDLEKQVSIKRVFSYKKRNVSLNFELNEDIEFLKDFKSLLFEARNNIDKVISELEK